MTFEHWFHYKRNKILGGRPDRFTFEAFKECWEAARKDLQKELLAELEFDWVCEDVCPNQCTGLREAKRTVKEYFVR